MSFRTDRSKLNSLTGIVVSPQAFATSHVTGGVSTDSQGNVSGSVSTEVLFHQKFFLQLPGGKEQEVAMQAMDANAFSVREGHRVTVTWFEGRPFHYFRNHTTDQECVNNRVLSTAIMRWWNAERPMGLAAYIAFALAMWWFIALQWKWEHLFSANPSFELYAGGDLLAVPVLIGVAIWLINKLLTLGEGAEWRHVIERTRAGTAAA